MVWNTNPTANLPFNQTDLLSNVEPGVCYGMCRKLLELDGSALQRASSAKGVYDIIVSRMASKKFIEHSRNAQAKRRQSGRVTVNPPLSEGVCYIIGCNISVSSGYVTRYSLISYFSPSAWYGDHAAFLFGQGGGTVLFEPNWGCALWDGMDIGKLTWSSLNDLVSGGYRNVPVYVTEVEK